jgi:carbamoyltransferase
MVVLSLKNLQALLSMRKKFSMKYTLGLCTMGSSSAALFKDGMLVAAVEEERLTRQKNDGAFPFHSIKEVLSIANIDISDVSQICIYWKRWQFTSRTLETFKKIFRNPNNSLMLLRRIKEVFFNNPSQHSTNGGWSDLFRINDLIKKNVGKFSGRIFFIDHHLSHQLYAEAMRDWDTFISLSYDGGGEEFSTVLSVVNNHQRTIISRQRWPNSLGHFYSTFTGFLGFKMLEGEYKMMGLAPYGQPKYKKLILEQILLLKPFGKYELNTKICDYHAALQGRFSNEMKFIFGAPRASDEEPTQQHIDLAASVQAVFEDALIHVLSPLVSSHPTIKNLTISGGCALNVTANGKLLSNTMFEQIIIPPAPHDAGCAVGACLAVLDDINYESIRSPYLGRTFTENEIKAAINAVGLNPIKRMETDELISITACLLAEKKIIAWFQGGAEFGPRALGNRSYLADPRDDKIRDVINAKIKKRELFRPFAPSVTAEAASQFFSISQDSPFMNIVSEVCSSMVPAITHVDNTARVHTVTKESNALYHQLLTEFGKITGVPVLLNTSFNIQEPIVYTPEEALRTFMASGVDALVIGPFIITRNELKN